MENKYYYGIYNGICYDNEDPENFNRITLKVPQVLHDNVSNWALPCLPPGVYSTHDTHVENLTSWAASAGTAHTHHVILNSPHSVHIKVPDVSQGVWVMFVGGDKNFPVWIGVQ